MECFTYLRNIQDLLSDGKTPYERRFGMLFNGPVTPFGEMVEYHLCFLLKTNLDCSSLGQKSCLVYFSVVHFTRRDSGKETLWSQIEELEEMDASELHARRLNAKEVFSPQRSGNFIFPVEGGTVQKQWRNRV